MGSVRSIIVRLVALGLIVLGWNGLEGSQFKRTYVEVLTLTFGSASAIDINAIFDESTGSFGNAAIGRIDVSGNSSLGVEVSGHSWQDTNQAISRFQNEASRAAAKRNLSITGTSSSGGSRTSTHSKQARFRFLAYAGVTMLGTAMLLLSLRIFGGGRPPEYQIPDTQSA